MPVLRTVSASAIGNSSLMYSDTLMDGKCFFAQECPIVWHTILFHKLSYFSDQMGSATLVSVTLDSVHTSQPYRQPPTLKQTRSN